MQIQLYNTRTKNISELSPKKDGEVGVYACGLTVYDYTHLGHLRKYSMDDVLIRALRYGSEEFNQKAYKVEFVQNVTDVGHLASDADTGEDKLEKGAKKYGKSVWDVAREFEDYFFMSMDKMGNLRPDVSCRATDHIKEQLEMVKTLEEKGFTYVIDGDGVYFDTSKFPEYGKMAGLHLEDQEAGARIGVNEQKRNPSDFALWKFEREGENRAMSWPSPWAEKSFPGWHIECSAMSMKYLGDQFDIHTGGIDHIPVHHTNEIAQAEAATGKHPFVDVWVHHNFLKVEGEKMSKSLGNFFTITDVEERGFHPRALRLLFLTAHYRSEQNFTWGNLEGSQKAYRKLLEQFLEFAESGNSEESEQISDVGKQYANDFFAAIAHDLNTAQAVSVMWSLVKDGTVSDAEKVKLLLEFDKVLALDLEHAATILSELESESQTSEIPVEAQKLLDAREAARAEKDFQKADNLREQLEEMGYEVIDSASGQQLKPK